ncbi:MAG: cell division protein FtsZ [Candidatus Hatepunaea meridiana]|nr:cell division protein FtsZ [Candidatus Hatepunaea meridiana]
MEATFNLLPVEEPYLGARIKVVGIGGAGGNAVDRMILSGLSSVDFIAFNTDAQALDKCRATSKVQFGRQITKGLGAGANPQVGKDAAEQDNELFQEHLSGADLVFITAGMGGGTGTGAAPLAAEIARSSGALTVAIVTKPFFFEGRRRMNVAEAGIKELREKVDTLIIVPNQQLMKLDNVSKLTFLQGFETADSILVQATKGISDLISVTGIVNLDFADVRSIMESTGEALIGIGTGEGEKRAVEAATQAITCPLLEDITIAGAQGVLVNITGSSEMTLMEVNEAASVIYEAAGDRANVIFGTVIDDEAGDEIRVTVIATGFNSDSSVLTPTLQPDKMVDYRPRKQDNLEEPAINRIHQNTGIGSDNLIEDTDRLVLRGQKRKSLAVDFDRDPPDLSVPTFVRNNGH